MHVTHRTYWGGQLVQVVPNEHPGCVQSITVEEGDLKKVGPGIMIPGEYDFGRAELQENIYVVFGSLVINGILVRPGDPGVTIPPGGEIKIVVEEVSGYFVRYGAIPGVSHF